MSFYHAEFTNRIYGFSNHLKRFSFALWTNNMKVSDQNFELQRSSSHLDETVSIKKQPFPNSFLLGSRLSVSILPTWVEYFAVEDSLVGKHDTRDMHHTNWGLFHDVDTYRNQTLRQLLPLQIGTARDIKGIRRLLVGCQLLLGSNAKHFTQNSAKIAQFSTRQKVKLWFEVTWGALWTRNSSFCRRTLIFGWGTGCCFSKGTRLGLTWSCSPTQRMLS